jgi:Fic family protein
MFLVIELQCRLCYIWKRYPTQLPKQQTGQQVNASDFNDGHPGRLVPSKNGILCFLPDSLPTNLRLDHSIRLADERANRAIGRLQTLIPTLPNPVLITTPFMRREAVLSSKIEGTRTELAGLFLFEELRCAGEDDSSAHIVAAESDAKEVFNYVVAQSTGYRMIKDIPIGMRVLCDMHEKLMDGIPGHKGFDKAPGRYRKTQAFIGPTDDIHEARYVAPPASEVERLMGDLEKFIHAPNDISSLATIALIHYQFEAIHPFFDGNGRLGRLLISLLLATKSILEEPILYLSAFFQRHKDEYVRLLLRVSTHGEWQQWVAFFLTGVEEVADDAVQRAASILKLREEYRSQFQKKHATAGKLLELLDGLFRWPLTSVKRAMDSLEMTHQGATKHIQNLVRAGIIEEVTGNKRNRLYMAKEIVELIS